MDIVQVYCTERISKTKAELIQYIDEKWARIEVKGVQRYCTNMTQQCELVKATHGGHAPF